jgi:hypothetical protein
MDQGLSTGAHQDIDGLRERNVRADSTVGREALTATGEAEAKDKAGNELKTFGRTPDGTGKPLMLEICSWRLDCRLSLFFILPVLSRACG